MITEAQRLNGEVLNNIQVSLQENVIIKSFEKFYENVENIKKFIPIINSDSNISIRLIDHFITKYCKKNKIIYKLGDQNFNVFISYKQQLKTYKKKYFDPFSRGDRIPYFIDNLCIITTIGQLNFFKWFISKKIYDYILNIQTDIENDMNKKNKIEKIKVNKEYKMKNKYKVSKNQVLAQTCNNIVPETKHIISDNTRIQKDAIIVSFTF